MTNQAGLKHLPLSLWLLRLGVFIVMGIWTLDKFVDPEHTARVFEVFYQTPGLTETLSYSIGALQAVIVFAFMAGFKKTWSYGIIFLMHLVSTLSSYERYLDPWTSPNLLFFAAWPMLAAIAVLFLLRDADTLFTLDKPKQ